MQREEWLVVPIRDVAYIQQGKWLPIDDQEGGPSPVFGANGVTGHTAAGHYEHQVVALGCRGTCGSVHIAPPDSWIGNNAMALWPRDSAAVNLTYLSLLLSTANLSAVTKTTAQPMIARGDLENLLVAIPPVDVQLRIANLISSADEMVTSLGSERVCARDARNALVRSSVLFSNFPTRKLGEVLQEAEAKKVANPSQYESLSVKLYGGGVVPSGKYPNVTPNGRPYFVRRPGEILVGRQNFHNGATGVVPNMGVERVTSNAISAFTAVDGHSSDYLLHVMQTPEVYQSVLPYISGTGQKETSMKILMSLEVPVPSRDQQDRVVEEIAVVNAKVAATTARLEAATALRDQLLHDLLSGAHTIPESYDRFLSGASQ